ncbi:hypothetical protein PYCCODRAFT_1525084 [Trametes coccinea BRFM310]|uniref:Uncharacterized protein n=1 Tax=Trametes coccinea (strain BRFM310) TaxID=1353009 RepID=A0A1Y2IBW0_TRAC3|nr:hypothetical protein PYCCODRAFT_1525084 [Trametes coccinea BRFM310]
MWTTSAGMGTTRVLKKFRKSNPKMQVLIPDVVPPTQLSADLQKCLEGIEDGILDGHIRSGDGSRKKYTEQYPLVLSLADVFVSNAHDLHDCTTYGASKKPRKQEAYQWLKVYQYQCTSSRIRSTPSTFEYESTLEMVARNDHALSRGREDPEAQSSVTRRAGTTLLPLVSAELEGELAIGVAGQGEVRHHRPAKRTHTKPRNLYRLMRPWEGIVAVVQYVKRTSASTCLAMVVTGSPDAPPSSCNSTPVLKDDLEGGKAGDGAPPDKPAFQCCSIKFGWAVKPIDIPTHGKHEVHSGYRLLAFATLHEAQLSVVLSPTTVQLWETACPELPRSTESRRLVVVQSQCSLPRTVIIRQSIMRRVGAPVRAGQMDHEVIDIDAELREEDTLASRQTSAGPPSAIPTSGPSMTASAAAELAEAFREAQLIMRAQEGTIRDLLAERGVGANGRANAATDGLAELSLPPNELKNMTKKLLDTARSYSIQIRPWVPLDIMSHTPSPSIDPFDPLQRYPNVNDPAAAADALRGAQIAELYGFVPKEVEPHITNAWVQRVTAPGNDWVEQFHKAVSLRKGHSLNNAKANRAAIFSHITTINANLFSAEAGLDAIRADTECKYLAGKPSQTWPPILYPEGKVGDKKYIFRNHAIWKAIRPMLYGRTALAKGHKPRGNTQGLRLQIRSVSFGMIAWGATVVRFFLSGDESLKPTGETSGITYMADFDAWVRRLILYQDSPSVQALIERMEHFLLRDLPSDVDAPIIDPTQEDDDDDDDDWDRLDDPESDGDDATPAPGENAEDEEELEYLDSAPASCRANGTLFTYSAHEVCARPGTPGGMPIRVSAPGQSTVSAIAHDDNAARLTPDAHRDMAFPQVNQLRSGLSPQAAVNSGAPISIADGLPSTGHVDAARNSSGTPDSIVLPPFLHPSAQIFRSATGTSSGYEAAGHILYDSARALANNASIAPANNSLHLTGTWSAGPDACIDPLHTHTAREEMAVVEGMDALRVSGTQAARPSVNATPDVLPGRPESLPPLALAGMSNDTLQVDMDDAASVERRGRGRSRNNAGARRAVGNRRRGNSRDVPSVAVTDNTHNETLDDVHAITRNGRPARVTRAGAARSRQT